MELEECQEFEKFAELFREKHERIVRDEIGYIYGKFERWSDEKNTSFDEYDLRCIDHIIYFHEKLFTWICDELIEDQMGWYPLPKKNWILKNRTILTNESSKNMPDKHVNIIEAVFYVVKKYGIGKLEISEKEDDQIEFVLSRTIHSFEKSISTHDEAIASFILE